MCVPNDRCVPEQRIQTKIPKFQDAQRGSFVHNTLGKLILFEGDLVKNSPFFLQSAHVLFLGFWSNSISIFVCLSFISLSATLACLVDILFNLKTEKGKEEWEFGSTFSNYVPGKFIQTPLIAFSAYFKIKILLLPHASL